MSEGCPCRCHVRDRWCNLEGGCASRHTARRCRSGEWCVEWEWCDAARVGAPINGETGLCVSCTDRVVVALRELPGDHQALAGVGLARGRDGAPVSGSRERPVPIRLDIDALQRLIVHTAVRWAEPVAERIGVGWDTRRVCVLPPRRALGAAVGLLVGHLSVLCAIHQHTGFAVIDGELETVEEDGLDGALALQRLHERAVRTVGVTGTTYRLPAPCPACERAAMQHRDGADTVGCAACGYTLSWDQWHDLTGAVLAAA